MSEYREHDFGATHGDSHLVIDADGMVYVALYEDGTWWEARPDDVRVQLETLPVALFDPQVSA